jgi:hypothetical protein
MTIDESLFGALAMGLNLKKKTLQETTANQLSKTSSIRPNESVDIENVSNRRVTRRSLKMAKQKQIEVKEEMNPLREEPESVGIGKITEISLSYPTNSDANDSSSDSEDNDGKGYDSDAKRRAKVQMMKDNDSSSDDEAEQPPPPKQFDLGPDELDSDLSSIKSPSEVELDSERESETDAPESDQEPEPEPKVKSQPEFVSETDSEDNSAQQSRAVKRTITARASTNAKLNRRRRRENMSARKNTSQSSRKVMMKADNVAADEVLTTPVVSRSRGRVQRTTSASGLRPNSLSRFKQVHALTPIKHAGSSAGKSKIPEMLSGHKSTSIKPNRILESGRSKESGVKQTATNESNMERTNISRDKLREMLQEQERACNEDLLRTRQQMEITKRRPKTVRSATAVKPNESNRRRRILHNEA